MEGIYEWWQGLSGLWQGITFYFVYFGGIIILALGLTAGGNNGI